MEPKDVVVSHVETMLNPGHGHTLVRGMISLSNDVNINTMVDGVSKIGWLVDIGKCMDPKRHSPRDPWSFN